MAYSVGRTQCKPCAANLWAARRLTCAFLPSFFTHAVML
jgi:hypothetical protein